MTDSEIRGLIKQLTQKVNSVTCCFCQKVDSCLDISESGNPDLVLNQQGDWISPGGSSGWLLTGNTGTDPTVNFIGTINNVPLVFRTKNNFAGVLDPLNNNVSFGNESINAFPNIGEANSAFGADVLSSIDINATNNVGIGIGAGSVLVSGSFNTIIGAGADVTLSTTSNAIALGSGAIAADNEFAIPDSVTKIKWRGISYTLPSSLPIVTGVLTCDNLGNLSWV